MSGGGIPPESGADAAKEADVASADVHDAIADGPLASCPGDGGPLAVNAGTFCIDSTEVTKRQYAAFVLAKGGDTSGQPEVCTWNTSYVPSCSWPLAGDGEEPVRCVDWCDAYGFCAWSGKRLCGDVRGGPLATELLGTAADQWYSACSHAGERAYPYGVYDPSACNGADLGEGKPVAVATLDACVGGYPGIFDMSGNVTEWIDSCEGNEGPNDVCIMENGADVDNASQLKCGRTFTVTRQGGADSHRGFRCCSR